MHIYYRHTDGSVLHATTADEVAIEHLWAAWYEQVPWCIGSWYYRLVNVVIDQPVAGEPSQATAIVEDIADDTSRAQAPCGIVGHPAVAP